MDVLLALSRGAGKTLRFLMTALLAVPYVLGWLAGVVVAAAFMTAAAARLGWTDVRRPRRDGHGAA